MNVRVRVTPYRSGKSHPAELRHVIRQIHFGASDDDCWPWLGRKIKGGYGKYGKGGIAAHRATYSLWRGEIPVGLTLDHLCRNTACVNPAHLEPVTMRENTRRGLLARGLDFRPRRTSRTTPAPRAPRTPRTSPPLRLADRHGTLASYSTDKCRCDSCRAAMAAYRSAYRAAGRDKQRPPRTGGN